MTAVERAVETVSVTIDGRQLDVPKGTLVIRAAEQLGIVIPRFCDHPLLDPIGACRQCMVEVEGQRKPFTACTTQCTEGMVVQTHLTSETAKLAQEGVIELLLINHPLDCPQCDKGGECPLQDQTLAHGAPDSRFIDAKRRYTKYVPISAQILLDRERCVLCARCTRFSQEISGDPFIELFERGALEQVAMYADEPYDSYYSGNVAQICPVGALTASTYRFHARPFDLRSVNGICNQCSNGCNLRVDVRREQVQRQLARDNPQVNESWNCDKGRFGFEYLDSEHRLREPLVRDELGTLKPATSVRALRAVAGGLAGVLESAGPAAVGVLTGGHLTDEDAYAVSRFARSVIGTDSVDFRSAPRTDEERDVLAAVAGTVGPTYDDVEAAPVVVVAGLDPEEEAPILHLRLRKAVRRRRQRIVVVGPSLGSLEGVASAWVATAAGGEAAALRALAEGRTPEPLAGTDPAEGAAEAVRDAGAGLVVLAGERLARSPGALRAAAGLAAGAGGAFAWIPRRAGARGAVDAGLIPGLLPGGRTRADAGEVGEVWGRLPEADGLDARGMLEAAAAGELKALYLIGVDPVRDFEDPALARRALEAVDLLVVQDLLATETTRYADVVLPASAPQERTGSFTTWEGRRQPFPQAVARTGLAREDWDLLAQLARLLGTDLRWETAGDVRREAASLMESSDSAAAALAALPPAGDAATPADREAGDQLDLVAVPALLGRGAMLVGADALKATARTPSARISVSDAERLGLADGDRVVLRGDAAELELPVSVTTSVAPGTVVVPADSTELPAAALSTAQAPRVQIAALAAAGEG